MLDNDPTDTDNELMASPAEGPDPAAQAPDLTQAPPTADPPRDDAPADPPRDDVPADTARGVSDLELPFSEPVKKAARKAAKGSAKGSAKKTTAKRPAGPATPETGPAAVGAENSKKPKKKAAARRKTAKGPNSEEPVAERAAENPDAADPQVLTDPVEATTDTSTGGTDADQSGEPSRTPHAPAAPPMVLFKAPEPVSVRKRATNRAAVAPTDADDADDADDQDQHTSARGVAPGNGANIPEIASATDDPDDTDVADDVADGPDAVGVEDGTDEGTGDGADDGTDDAEGGPRRRRRRGGRRRRKPSDGEGTGGDESAVVADDPDQPVDPSENGDPSSESEGDADGEAEEDGNGSRRRRRRRRPAGEAASADNGNARARKPRNPEDEIASIGGSTRLEAKKQRRREGRETGRRRAPIVSEAEFLARRESVDRVMVIRQQDDLTQIGVLEDKVLVEHYVARDSQTSLIGNVYLGRVQNVLPSMEAAFIDIGKGRNAVLYAGEVNWSAVGHKDGQQRKMESVLSSGQTILVQVSKDPVGHKGARLTGQVSLPGRFLVYVPDGNTSGISRKLPDTERNRLKALLKQIVPGGAGVIVRTAAEGASEEELTLDVERLTARWADIEAKMQSGRSPQLLYGEPDLTLKVVRDLFTEDFTRLVVQGDEAWDLVENYVSHVAPELKDRLERYQPGENGTDTFAGHRVNEQIAKGLERKVWLPSGGSLVIDRTEAMTVVDVNTGKFTGSGGNLEETVTKNNLEAAEEMVRQLRLRDIGGIIVIDFIDMVLESNRDLVLRRLVECLGRDRTRHQVAEVTSLGLVQMTRKRIGTGLVEAFSSECDACKGRGLVLQDHPVESNSRLESDDARGRGRGRGGRARGSSRGNGGSDHGDNSSVGSRSGAVAGMPSPADLANSRRPDKVLVNTADGVEIAGSADVVDPGHSGDSGEDVDRVDLLDALDVPDTGDDQEGVDLLDAEDALTLSHRDDSTQDVDGADPAETVAMDTAPHPSQAPLAPTDVGVTSDSPALEEERAGAAKETPHEPPAAPSVVRSTRRRTARRPAGPPGVPSPHEPDSVRGTDVDATSRTRPAGADAPPAEPYPHAYAAERGETAPHGDPDRSGTDLVGQDGDQGHDHDQAGEKPEGDPDNDSDTDPSQEPDGDPYGEADGDPDNGSSLVHVPVKRRGSRKR